MHYTLPHYPNHFIKLPQSQKEARAITSRLFETDPHKLVPYPFEGNFFISLPANVPLSHGQPNFLVMRFDKVFNAEINVAILAGWIELEETGITHSEKRMSRSLVKAIHAALWSQYSSFPMITLDSRDQSADTLIALDKLLLLIRKYVAPRLFRLLWRYDYNNWYRQQV